MFIPLRVISDYSLLKSLISLPKLIDYLKANNIKVCGICDENLFSAMEFYDLCTLSNIKPLIGLKIPFLNTSISLYVKNYDGYLNLLKIHTMLQKKEDLTKLKKEMFLNLLVVMDAIDLEDYDEVSSYFDASNFYVGYKNSIEKNNAYLKTNQVVFFPEIRAFKSSDIKYLDVLKAILLNTTLSDIKSENESYESFEVFSSLADDERILLENFANLCDLTIPKNGRFIPHYDNNITDSYAYLKALSKKGLEKRLNNKITKEYVLRLKYELDVINKMGFVDYFLIVYDYVKYAKQKNILVGLGRGSAAGSLVSYTLGITDVDPIKYNLLFERFLNIERITMPDIDIDFEDSRRWEVIEYVKQKYGNEYVANIITFGTLKCKLALRSVGKVFQIDNQIIDDFVSLFDPKKSIRENLVDNKIKQVLTNNENLQKVLRASLKIEGLKKHISTHAAGIVISSVKLEQVIPVTYNNNELLTGVQMNYLEELGLLKMDFLGIRNLTTIANILDLIKQDTNKTINLNNIDYNDKYIMQLFANGDTTGIFQFESEGMKAFLKKLKPTCLEDIISAIALFRPGPMENIDSYIRRKEGKEKIVYFDPSLEPILKETYGIIVYQEQIMQILVLVGNYSFSEADLIRRAMSKKKMEVIAKEKVNFVSKAIKNNYQKEVAIKIYDLILKFANYGFNKSHSVSYALIGIQMAYLKYYYSKYFLIHLLNMAINSISKTKEYFTLAREKNIKFLPPHINKSEEYYVLENNYLRIPFSIIKNIGNEAVKSILEERKKGEYKDFLDFVRRTYGKSVNKKTIEWLIKAGVFDSFKENHNTLLHNLDLAISYASLATDIYDESILKPVFQKMRDLTDDEKRKEEYEIYNFYIKNHPSSKYQDANILKLKNAKEAFDKYVSCVVLIEKIKIVKTKNNENMAFILASDETANFNFVIFHQEMAQLNNIKQGDFVNIKGRVTKRFADYQININKIEKINKEE